jgi:eukaryotic-like serine/threonine-protein kinase
MSRVFLAEEIALGRQVVVKVLAPDLAASVNAQRFRREIQLAARLQHPHIVPLLSTGVTDGIPYYTMPFIEGETLRARLARVGALPIYDIEKILAEVLSALDYAHRHDVVHRDIKPGNILLTGHHAVVTDFGVAKAISAATDPDGTVTATGMVVGTPAYMAPEQAAGDRMLDHRADLYAIGAVAYEMLTGGLLFSQRSTQAMLAAHATELPEPVTKRRAAIPPRLADLVMQALQKNPADRPQSAEEMLKVVENAITSGTGGSPPPHPRQSSIGPRLRRPTVMAVGIAGLLVLLSSSSGYWYRHRRVEVAEVRDAAPSLAVLPFENLGRPDDAYFADGMTDEIRNRLGGLSGLRIVGRQSAQRYIKSDKSIQQIGRELGVKYLLTGTVRWDRSNGHSMVRVSPALLRVSDGTQLWSEPSQDQVNGVFKIESEVAERVARELQVRLPREEFAQLSIAPTQNLAAYDDYLRGRRDFDNGRAGSSIPFFERAAIADPKFALALAYLGRARVDVFWDWGGGTGVDSLIAARKEIDSALALDPKLAAAHTALGDFYYHAQLDYANAAKEFAEAERLAPNDPDPVEWGGYVERRQAHWTEGLRDLRRANALDPRRPGIKTGIADLLRWLRRYDESDEMNRQALAVDSTWTLAYTLMISNAIDRDGNTDSALKLIRRLRKVDSTNRQIVWQNSWIIRGDKRLRGLVRLSSSDNRNDSVNYYIAVAAMAQADGDRRTMLAAADSVIANASRELRPAADLSPQAAVYGDLATGYAFRGDIPKTIETNEKILRAQRVARDSLRKLDALAQFAYNTGLAGANDKAIPAFEELLNTDHHLSRATLRISPALVSLRRDPRFQRLIAEPSSSR